VDEPSIRLGIFLGLFLLLALWELRVPRRQSRYRRRERWPHNLGLLVIDIVVVRLLFPAAAVGTALWVEAGGFGVLNRLDWPPWLEAALAIIALDLAIYGQHVVTHKVRWLWRLHRVHHADPDFDVTTALRFHPIEILLSLAYKGFVIYLLGASPLAVLIFEVLLNAGSLFTHANAGLPRWLDLPLRRVLVTPDMHRVHHSPVRAETDSNYGFFLSAWDHLFGTYRVEPTGGRDGQEIGLKEISARSDNVSLPGLLLVPFKRFG
jgi:sterol desaturase/sphingolipid hydroxylase (fatty acid hydroxylase superfamily)